MHNLWIWILQNKICWCTFLSSSLKNSHRGHFLHSVKRAHIYVHVLVHICTHAHARTLTNEQQTYYHLFLWSSKSQIRLSFSELLYVYSEQILWRIWLMWHLFFLYISLVMWFFFCNVSFLVIRKCRLHSFPEEWINKMPERSEKEHVVKLNRQSY